MNSLKILLFTVLLTWHTHITQAKNVSKRQLCSGGGCGNPCGGGGCNSERFINVRPPVLNPPVPIYQPINRPRIIQRPIPLQTCPGGRCVSSCSGGGCADQIIDTQAPVIDQRYPVIDIPLQTCPGGRCGSSCNGGGCPDNQIVDAPAPLIDQRSQVIDTPLQTCPGGRCVNPCGTGGCNDNQIIDAPAPPIDARSQIIETPLQTCPGGRCGSVCNGGGCNDNTNRIIVDSGYNEVSSNIDRTPIINRPAPVQTCSSCIQGCSNECSSNQCVNTCLNSCRCTDNTRVIPQESLPQNENQCCQVLHPKECYTEESGNRRCVAKRHRECSGLCTSSVVSIHESEEAGNRGCQYIRNYPYVYCGNYERSNCGQCYTCDGVYNPRECSRRSECTESCRNNAVRYY